jgi:hypothetical protein
VEIKRRTSGQVREAVDCPLFLGRRTYENSNGRRRVAPKLAPDGLAQGRIKRDGPPQR